MNQLGLEGRSSPYNPQPYADTTGYTPTNSPSRIRDLRKWQPQLVTSAYGTAVGQGFVTPQWALTTPFSFEDPKQFSAAEPMKSYDVTDGQPGMI